jgi:hypothetical protein
LRDPCGELAVAIEPVSVPDMADEIVNGAEAVVGAARFVPEDRVLTVSVNPSRDDFQRAGGAYGGNHFNVGRVGREAPREGHSYTRPGVLPRQRQEQSIRLHHELSVGRAHGRVPRHARSVQKSSGYLMGERFVQPRSRHEIARHEIARH